MTGVQTCALPILRWGVAGIIVVGLALGLGWFLAPPENSQPVDQKVLGLRENEWIYGDREAPATLIEYADFQCPACGVYYPLIKTLEQNFPDKLAVVFRHFPLSAIHFNALPAARVAEAAGKQGKFWEMHDKLFEKQNEWSDLNSGKAKDAVIKYAETMGLDKNLFESQIDSSEVKDKVEADSKSGLKSGVNSTPTFILNGKKIQPRSYDEFKQLIEKELSPNS